MAATGVPDDNAKRRQILEGARQVFMRDGFDGASMNDVARVAGVSKGTLYVYFESKVSLFEALVREDRQQRPNGFALCRRRMTTRSYAASWCV